MKELSPAESQRKSLLPIFVIFFCWVFIVVAILGFLIVTILSIMEMKYIIYFREYIIILPLLMFFILLGLTSFNLLRGKKRGVYLGIIQGLIGLLLSVIYLINDINIIIFAIILGISINWTLIMFKIKDRWL